MVGHPGLGLYPRPGRPAAPPDQAPGPHDEREGLLGGRQPRREQVQIDVEEGDARGAAHPVQDRLGPHEHGRVGHRVSTGRDGAGYLADLCPEQRGELLAQPAHTGAQRLHAQAATGHAHDGPRLAAARTAQYLFAARMLGRRAAAGTAGQLATVPAGEKPCAARAVVDAHERSAGPGRRVVEHGTGQPDELLGEQAGSGVGAAPVHPLEGRANPIAPGSAPARRFADPPARPWLTGGIGEARMHGAPSRRARSTTTSTALYVGALSSR